MISTIRVERGCVGHIILLLPTYLPIGIPTDYALIRSSALQCVQEI